MTIATRRSRPSLYWIVISLLFMLSGCATDETRAPVPRWVIEGRESTEDYVFFLGTGTSESGSIVVFVDLWSTDHGNRRAAEVNIVEL